MPTSGVLFLSHSNYLKQKPSIFLKIEIALKLVKNETLISCSDTKNQWTIFVLARYFKFTMNYFLTLLMDSP